ncbi:MAG: endolytic transglycosylase MltG [Parcubacteria group bacterium]|nr:endolytic transglycosylase MltG [Parcubacteria group bacterium]
MNKKIIYVIFMFFVAAFAVSTLVFWWQIRTPFSRSVEIKLFKVLKGESAKVIAEHLKNSNLIENPFFFQLYVFLSLRQYALKSGEYELSQAMSIRDIADTIVLGGTNEVLITIPEGFTLKQIEQRFIAAGLAEQNEFVSYKFSDDTPAILSDKPKSASLEGYLFPDTYRFFKDVKLPDIVSKMVVNLDNKLTSDLKIAVKNSSYTFYEILTMASLIEKEVKSDADREIVSGILWKRLKAKVPLQVDATLVYITGRKEISDADKKINSPYNTYYYRGLPKGPIANPGLPAIRAAIFPKSSSYWYYLSAKDGATIFSKTLEEHNSNRAIYLK